MSSDRRQFLKLSATAGGALSMATVAASAAPRARAQGGEPGSSPSKKRILILGGTGQTGPHQVRYALERGHDVTLFNRGKTPADVPEEVTWLKGDRNGDLSALEDKEWDVVIDNPTSLAVLVRDAASLLKDSVGQYIFVSTISVYAENDTPGADETAALAPYTGADAMAETQQTLQADMGLYGPLKAKSEEQAERWFPGRTTIVRPGLIVGARDWSDRFSYWPVRVQRGGEVLAPPAEDPVQLIDGQDLAQWTVRLAENGTIGTFNATGPTAPLTVGGMLWGCWAATGGDVRFVHVPAEFLAEQGIGPWSQMPVWIPPSGPMAGFTRRSIERARAAGLTFRPLADTVSDLLAWHDQRPEAQRGPTLRAGISPEREAKALAAWHAASASSED